ncbi:Glycogen debranching enzyme [Psilocybe cubensis]|uniref:Glycogen debranching enzyme n=1 Tax=Psilocybe cubensis TaxID=181762 RepID=A0ACB8GVX2_PSICU|nr:Glycogen debranching enzyme [Psilocybe cubensis]KAH9479582.1 Glycogen debranching enzyme [Psilocybe cubensis]
MAKGRKHAYGRPKPSLTIPRQKSVSRSPSASPSPTSASPLTPRTPADEGIEYFQSHPRPGDAPVPVYELCLDPDGGPSNALSYIRLPPAYTPYILRVSIQAGTPAAKNGVFKTNFPLDGGAFARDRYAKRKLPQEFSKPIKVDLPISHAGAFIYWVEYDGDDGKRVKGREGYFNIDPVLTIKARTPVLDKASLSVLPPGQGAVLQDKTVHLPLNGLSILTVVSKWMGPIDEWKKSFAEAKDRGYTMLHYTPLQERGESDSPYSIRNQHKYDASLFGKALSEEEGRKRVEEILKVAREDYGLLSLTDVVLNHTANDSPWLAEHPEAGFSPANTPHLAPALELDTAILDFSGSLEQKGIPTTISSEGDINAILGEFEKTVKDLNLWQYYVLDVVREKASVTAALSSGKVEAWSGPDIKGKNVAELAEIFKGANKIKGLGAFASRFGVGVDGATAAGFTQAAFADIKDTGALADAWGKIVDVINVPLYREWEEDTKIAIDHVRNRVKYTRLDEHGPKLGRITRENPLVEPYFTRLSPKPNADPLVYSLANNGWIWNADPLQNFALLPSKAYLRREVIVWGDCVKLRYGSQPSDNPWLWSHMTSYVTSLAQTFDGFRIDNCHSTPLEVGTRMLDAARVARPDLYVCAELFTGSEDMDLVFVRELGINSLIRESGNGWDPKELSRLLYRHGVGKPIGSMDGACMQSKEEIASPTGKGPIRTAVVIPLNGSQPHALLYDLTHDNESPLDKRSAEDALSTGALVAFSYCAVGSVKGFDDLYPKLLNLVKEKRKYELTGVCEKSGIAKVKRVLNELHLEMVLNGYEEGHVHQENDYIVLHRVQPVTQKGYLLVAHTAFSKGWKGRGNIDPIKLRRTKAKFILGASLNVLDGAIPDDPNLLKGLASKLEEMDPVVVPQGLDHEGPYAEIVVPEYFPPGSIMVFETQLQQHDSSLDAFCASGAQEAFSEVDLVDLNVILHRADVEERDATAGVFGTYDVPGLGKLVYCGLEGDLLLHEETLRIASNQGASFDTLRRLTAAVIDCQRSISHTRDLLASAERQLRYLHDQADRVRDLQDCLATLSRRIDNLAFTTSLSPAILSGLHARLDDILSSPLFSRSSTPDSLPDLEPSD